MKTKKIFLIAVLLIICIFILSSNSNADTLGYKINKDSKIIYWINPEISYIDFLNNVKSRVANSNDVFELRQNGTKVTSGIVKTGMKLVINSTENYDISVIGDINGDGLFDQMDLANLIRHYVGISDFVLTDKAKLKSADANNSGNIDLTDISVVINSIVKETLPIDQRPGVDEPKVTGSISLSATSGTTDYPQVKTVTITTNSNGALSASSSNTGVATASINNKVLTIKPVKPGNARITVSSEETESYTAATATYDITVDKGVQALTITQVSGPKVLIQGEPATFKVNGANDRTISVNSTNTSIATVNSYDESTNIITVTGNAVGNGEVKVIANESEYYRRAEQTFTFKIIRKQYFVGGSYIYIDSPIELIYDNSDKYVGVDCDFDANGKFTIRLYGTDKIQAYNTKPVHAELKLIDSRRFNEINMTSNIVTSYANNYNVQSGICMTINGTEFARTNWDGPINRKLSGSSTYDGYNEDAEIMIDADVTQNEEIIIEISSLYLTEESDN